MLASDRIAANDFDFVGVCRVVQHVGDECAAGG